MLDESLRSIRPLRPNELALLASLLGEAEPVLKSRLAGCLVEDMADGAMGSIRFLPPSGQPRLFGRRAVEALYTDVDGVRVIISLNLDKQGDLYELDFWKADFSPLRAYPDPAGNGVPMPCER